MATTTMDSPAGLEHGNAQAQYAHQQSIAHPGQQPSAQTMNILLTTFAGLGLERTMTLRLSPSTPISEAVAAIHSRLPAKTHRLIITTNSNKQLLSTSTAPIVSLTDGGSSNFLPLRLNGRLCGGKGGFGSQLRAAGGRMSSRKNRNNQAAASGSNRNLDGRRLRTVDEAKKLAEYLAIKPEMEKREKEERKKRWEAVVEAADRREADIKSGKAGNNGGRLDAEYVESKELAEEKTREAVMKALREGLVAAGMDRTGSESSADEGEQSSEEGDEEASSGSSGDVEVEDGGSRSFFGWDEDDDDEDISDEGEDEDADEVPATYEGKGKGKI